MQPAMGEEEVMQSDFIEIAAVPADPKAENAEIILALLSEFPFTAFEYDGMHAKAWVEAEQIDIATMEEACEAIEQYCEAKPEISSVEKQNWNEEWESNYFEPVTVNNCVHVRAPFHPQVSDFEHIITIEPRMSFGTGHHQTTQLMISLMLSHREKFAGSRLLDMGSGTGVLGILAEKLGAADVVAIDNESWAAENAAENAQNNGCAHFQSLFGDAGLLLEENAGSFDIVLANIHLNVLMTDGAAYKRVLKPNGIIFLSGFYTADMPLLRAKFESLGCNYLTHEALEGWCALAMASID